MAARDATPPDLQLHDILHNLSPSPTPLRLDSDQNTPRSVTPEILTEADVAQMRHRVAELRNSSQGLLSLTEREKELFNMVLRLTESTLVDPDQLIRQAEVISCLTAQRDFLIRQTEEERRRWASQQDGWDRMAEALIAQRSKSLSGPTKEDIDRYCAAYQFENKTLRDKLSDTSSRLQHLESEITKLRPILLMQPVTTASAISQSHLSGVPYPSIHAAAEKVKTKKKKKKEPRVPVFSAHLPDEQEPQEQAETQSMEGAEKIPASSSFSQFQAQPILPPTQQTFNGDHYRKPATTPVGGPLTSPPTTLEFQVSTPTPQPPKTVRTIRRSSAQPADTNPSTSAPGPLTPGRSGPTPKKSKRNGPHTSLTSDARTEHLLLASRKIGRERAGIVAGYVRDRQKELEMQKHERDREKMVREFERDQAEKERLERIAERGPGGLSYYRRDVVEAGPSNSGKAGLGSSPQTPKKGGSSLHFARGSPVPPGPRINPVYGSVEALARGKGKAPQNPKMANGSAPDLPQQQHNAAGAVAAQRTQPQTNPSTPLSSLIDAARMMGGNQETGVQVHNGGEKGRKNGVNGSSSGTPGRGRDVEQSESPAPKRRRIASARAAAAAATVTKSSSSSSSSSRYENGSGSGSGTGSRNENGGDWEGVDSAMTALHVLADQAAAFSSHDLRGKGKAREVQDDEEDEFDDGEGDADYAPAGSSAGTRKGRRGRQPAKEREKEKEKTKPRTTMTRKSRGKATVVTPTAAPRLISSPAPKLFAGPSHALPPGDGHTVSTASPTTGNGGFRHGKSLGPAPAISAQVSQPGEGDRKSLDTPSRSGRGNSEEEHLAGALLELAPPIEIHSSSLPRSPHKHRVIQQVRPLRSEGSKRVVVSGYPSIPVSSKVAGQAHMDGYVTAIAGESEELEADGYETAAAVDLSLQRDANDDEDKRTEPVSGPLDSAPHDPSSNAKNGGGIEDGEADAEGEVDAEGEIDLEDESPSQALIDSTVTVAGDLPSLPAVDGQRVFKQQA